MKSLYGKILGDLLIAERNVTELCPVFFSDSRRVVPGSGFAAVPGTAFDGHDFIYSALEKGASLIVMEKEMPLPPGTPVLLVKECAAAFALLVRHTAGDPDKKLRLYGVTGTNGKTTSAFLLALDSDTCSDRVDALVVRLHCNLGALARYAYHLLDGDESVVDFRNFLLEELFEEFWSGS